MHLAFRFKERCNHANQDQIYQRTASIGIIISTTSFSPPLDWGHAVLGCLAFGGSKEQRSDLCRFNRLQQKVQRSDLGRFNRLQEHINSELRSHDAQRTEQRQKAVESYFSSCRISTPSTSKYSRFVMRCLHQPSDFINHVWQFIHGIVMVHLYGWSVWLPIQAETCIMCTSSSRRSWIAASPERLQWPTYNLWWVRREENMACEDLVLLMFLRTPRFPCRRQNWRRASLPILILR
jgi:hypothetical protein